MLVDTATNNDVKGAFSALVFAPTTETIGGTKDCSNSALEHTGKNLQTKC